MKKKYSLENIEEIVSEIFSLYKDQTIFLFQAEMGSGKTTMIKKMCEQLGCNVNELSSPTYTIVNEYKDKLENTVLHIDLYRLKNIEELFNIGWDEYLQHAKYIFIEWPELLIPYLNQSHVEIHIEPIDETTREITTELVS